MIIYVVIGSTGEYSDRCEHVVCALRDEDAAKVFVERATKYAKHLAAICTEDRYGSGDAWRALAATSPFDKGVGRDYTGPTEYTYGAAEVIDDVPVLDIGEVTP